MIETYSRLLYRYILTLSEINIFCDISNSTIFLSFFDVDTENAHHTEKVLICSLLCTQDILLVTLNPTIGLSFRLLIIFCIFLLVVNSTDKAGEIGTRLGGRG